MLVMIEYETFNAKSNDAIDNKTKLLVETGLNSLPQKVNLLINKLEENQEGQVIVECPFGKRSKDLVRVINGNNFKNNKIRPAKGMIVSLDGRRAIVKSVNGSRIIVDLNHPLANKDINYKIKILKKSKDNDISKTKMFLNFYSMEGEVEQKDDKIIIKTKEDNDKKIENLLKNMKLIIKKDIQIVNPAVNKEIEQQ